MARISVEQKALTDPRFDILAQLLGSTRDHALGVMVRVWNECQELEKYELPRGIVGALLGRVDAASLLTKSGLARPVSKTNIYICGTIGRIEWLANRRKEGRLGGRPAKTLGLTVGLDGKQQADNPPAPAPTPTPTQKELIPNTSIQPSAELDPPSGRRVKPRKKPEPDEETMRFFLAFYGDYPRHEGRMEALRAFVKLNPDKDLLRTISRDIQTRINSGKWQPDIPEKVQFIPLPASYLNGRRWEDGQFS